MNDLARRMEDVRERVAGIPPRTRAYALTAVAVLVAIGAAYYATTREVADAVLFSRLDEEDAAGIVARLGEMNVPYELADGGTTVRVPEERVHELRLGLSLDGLPAGGGVGFEIFDEQRFGESEFAERVKYHRALEGELSRTLSHLSGVESVRVHLVLPQRTLFTREEEQASASVVLGTRPGYSMEEARVRGVVNLVASSVRGLAPEDVTIVDGQGRNLTDELPSEERAATDALEFRRSIEREKERAAQRILDAALGAGRSVTRVAADISFTREERTEERFEPDTVATRSIQLEEERDPSSATETGGIPGTPSNLPGGEAATVATTETGLVRRRETRNYEVTKLVRHAVDPVGQVQRLHVAVLVDGRWTGEGEARVFEALDEEELARLSAVVSHAVGLDTERGDRVTVECVPFATEPEPDEVVAAAPGLESLRPYEPYLPYAAGAALLLIGMIVFVARAIRRKRKGPPEAEITSVAAASEALEAISARLEQPLAEANAPDDGLSPDSARLLSAELVRQDPEVAARVLQSWLTEETA